MRLIVQTEYDEPGFLRAVRVGQWIHWYDYITGEGTWKWRPQNFNPGEIQKACSIPVALAESSSPGLEAE